MDSEFIRALETINGAFPNQSTNCSRSRFLGDADKLCDERERGRRGDGRADGRTDGRTDSGPARRGDPSLSLSLRTRPFVCLSLCSV